MLGGTAVFITSLVDITFAKTVVPTTLAGIVVPATFVVTVVSTIIFQVSPCMADKWESLLSNLGHTYRKLRRLYSFFFSLYICTTYVLII